MRNKSTAVLPITPRSRLASQKAGSTPPRITPSEFGEHLQRGRQQTQRSLQEIADATKISMHQLRALERGDLDRLPDGLYRRAIVRQYAETIGLNVEQTIRDLERVSTDVDVDAESLEAFARRGDAGSSPFTTAWWSSAAALVVLGAAAALATAWYRAGTAAPAAPPVTANAPTPEAEAPAIALVAATEAVRANAGDIELATEPAVSPTPTETGSVADDATEGELRITSEPAGALVTVNGVGWGPTPVTIRYMPFGRKVIRAAKPGYVSAQRGFDFIPDRRVRSVRIQLSPQSAEAR